MKLPTYRTRHQRAPSSAFFDGLAEGSYTGLQLVATGAAGVEHTIVPDGYRNVMGSNWSLVIRRTIAERDEKRREELLKSMWAVLDDHDQRLAEATVVRFYTVRRSVRPDRWNEAGEEPRLILTAHR